MRSIAEEWLSAEFELTCFPISSEPPVARSCGRVQVALSFPSFATMVTCLRAFFTSRARHLLLSVNYSSSLIGVRQYILSVFSTVGYASSGDIWPVAMARNCMSAPGRQLVDAIAGASSRVGLSTCPTMAAWSDPLSLGLGPWLAISLGEPDKDV